ncbi:dGTP triphosphohydrolase [Candidatus Scalindua japonica]|uniref:dGTP triphosphohydrolase n=2 Tax=Candidatus Scalindua japonica TaxID=1284222 RepID=A0A286U2V9_9BACT|nr:dGTP triphosphohydrolase [Candidatus Scalindua japonica]
MKGDAMITETEEQSAVFFDTENRPYENKAYEISLTENYNAEWMTPGFYLAERIKINSLVRFVGEEKKTDHLQIVVVVDDDTDDLADSIFSIEQEMYDKFKNHTFDLRLRVISKDESIEDIENCSIVYYDRKKFETSS